jgi:arylsulfatase A-like enzyme
MPGESIDRTRLPIRRPPFQGVINRTLAGSQPDWGQIGHMQPPQGAPNVLLVLIDDAGFGNPSTFGGPVDTPSFTRMAEAGLRYNRFHVTALCSPTRAALLTGRNHHTVGFGSIGELSSGFPGYTAFVPKDCAPFPRVLQENGYSTAAIGKWHLTPDGQQGPAGPFDRWPTGWGFDYFWGFLGGESGQWDPVITENQKTIGVPEGNDGQPYYLPDDMADKTIEWLHGVRAQDPDKPWFVYFSTGCSHAPHHVPKEWADKYRGRFDQGWDTLREEVFERQKRLGVVPADAELTPRNDAFPAWDSLDADQRRLYARQMEVYAGYSENADHNVGRVLDAIAEMGELEDTLVIWIWGDNGSSMEGTLTGSFNELTMQNGIPLTPEQQLALVQQYGGLEVWGSELIAPHFSAAWAWAGNAPFQWGKQVASHLGGTRNPAVAHWPARTRDQGWSAPTSPT